MIDCDTCSACLICSGFHVTPCETPCANILGKSSFALVSALWLYSHMSNEVTHACAVIVVSATFTFIV